ncbi:hypothetical protein ACFSR2_20365, partial [Emticicia soli]
KKNLLVKFVNHYKRKFLPEGLFMFTILSKTKNTSNKTGEFLLTQSRQYLLSLLTSLDNQIDKRLSRTFFDLFMAILVFRNQKMGLLLSELGAYICGFAHAPAGTKRISNLLRSKKWESKLVDNFLFSKAKERIRDLQARGLRPLLLWDDSRIEKPESWRPTLGLWRAYVVWKAVRGSV